MNNPCQLPKANNACTTLVTDRHDVIRYLGNDDTLCSEHALITRVKDCDGQQAP